MCFGQQQKINTNAVTVFHDTVSTVTFLTANSIHWNDSWVILTAYYEQEQGNPCLPGQWGTSKWEMLLTLSANIHEDRKNEAGYTICKAFEGCILTKKQNMEDTDECALA